MLYSTELRERLCHISINCYSYMKSLMSCMRDPPCVFMYNKVWLIWCEWNIVDDRLRDYFRMQTETFEYEIT